MNDLGFSYRTDRRDMQGSLAYVENEPGKRIRRWNVEGAMRSEHNFAWEPILTVGTVHAQMTTISYWTVVAAGQRFFTIGFSGGSEDLDFNFRSLRGNAVLRWEWRAGSTLYLAWQQRRSDYAPIGDFDLGRDSRALLDARPDNILLVKMNYWLTP